MNGCRQTANAKGKGKITRKLFLLTSIGNFSLTELWLFVRLLFCQLVVILIIHGILRWLLRQWKKFCVKKEEKEEKVSPMMIRTEEKRKSLSTSLSSRSIQSWKKEKNEKLYHKLCSAINYFFAFNFFLFLLTFHSKMRLKVKRVFHLRQQRLDIKIYINTSRGSFIDKRNWLDWLYRH